MADDAKSSELTTRLLSGVVMLVAALGLLWLGGIPFLIACIVLGGMVFMEFSQLVTKFATGQVSRFLWMLFGLIYASGAVWALWQLRERQSDGVDGFAPTLAVLALVWAVDIGAYFTGRTFGGPKIWPAISPSKTWSGFAGGAMAAGLLLMAIWVWMGGFVLSIDSGVFCIVIGAIICAVAQSGDFFQSWMKRRAGVKDSGTLIPGHGGVFDRLDGTIPVVIIIAVLGMVLAG